MKGLKLLNKADANVEISVLSTGEHVIATSGELHLERCLRDMKDRFAQGIRMRVSPPLITLRETLIDDLNLNKKLQAINKANLLLNKKKQKI